MKKLAVLIAALCVIVVSFSQNMSAKLDTILSTYAHLHKFNGSVLVAKKSIILLNKGYGYRNAAGKIVNDENTIYQLGSITKQFTAVIIPEITRRKKAECTG